MIPLQITLEGFLSYRDETTISFEGAALWMLAGANGAGKSSVFDAMRWTLFGAHRGGKSGHEALIHRDRDRMRVAFDIALGGERFRLLRTLARAGRSTWQIEAMREGETIKIPETDGRDGYEKWVRERVGLSDETFTTAMYLAQNRGDAMLSASAAQRYEMLAEIVDISAYAALHERAKTQAASLEIRAKTVEREWETAPEIAPETIAEAGEKLLELDAQIERNQTRRETLLGLEPLAAQWQDLETGRGAARENLETARLMLADAPQIQRDFARHSELRTLLPPLQNYAAARQRDAQNEADLSAARAEMGAARAGLDAANATLETGQSEAARLEDERRNAELARGSAGAEKAELAPRLALSRQIAGYRGEIGALETQLRAFPAALTTRKTALENRLARGAQELAAGTVLRRFAREKGFYRAAAAQEVAAQTALESAQVALPVAQCAAESARLELENARLGATGALKIASSSATRFGDAQSALERFESVQNEADCYFCGQKLTPQHRERERKRLETALDAARNAAAESREAQIAADRATKNAEKRDKTAQAQLQNAQIAFERARDAIPAARRSVAETTRTALETLGEIGPQWRSFNPPATVFSPENETPASQSDVSASDASASDVSLQSLATAPSSLAPSQTGDEAGSAPVFSAQNGAAIAGAVLELSSESAANARANGVVDAAKAPETSAVSAASEIANLAASPANRALEMTDAPLLARENDASPQAITDVLAGDFPDLTRLVTADAGAAAIENWRLELDDVAAQIARRESVAGRLADRRGQLEALLPGAPIEELAALTARDEALQLALNALAPTLKRVEIALAAARSRWEMTRRELSAAREIFSALENRVAALSAAQVEISRAVLEAESALSRAVPDPVALQNQLRKTGGVAPDGAELASNSDRTKSEATHSNGAKLTAKSEDAEAENAEFSGFAACDAAGLRAALSVLQREFAALEKREIGARLERLRPAQRRVAELEAEVSRLETALQNVPLEARRAPAELQNEAAALKTALDDDGAARARAQLQKSGLEAGRAAKTRLENEHLDAQNRARQAKTLADLLGPHQLQRFLLREAENGIIDEANATLDRISGGGLRLELRADDEEIAGARKGVPKVLDMAIFQAGDAGNGAGQAMLPAFLSGSQRFRVAVSLALGIGRYATRGGASRLEAVIIDEGFGALDKIGRGEMITELQNLGEELQRVILVSHQEEFFEAFPNRYLIENDGGTSIARLMAT